jgi:hypothetical protein
VEKPAASVALSPSKLVGVRHAVALVVVGLHVAAQVKQRDALADWEHESSWKTNKSGLCYQVVENEPPFLGQAESLSQLR